MAINGITKSIFGITYNAVPLQPEASDILWLEHKLRCEFDRKKEIHELAAGVDYELIERAERYRKMGMVTEEFVKQLKQDIL